MVVPPVILEPLTANGLRGPLVRQRAARCVSAVTTISPGPACSMIQSAAVPKLGMTGTSF
jgi:hypothetical protein